MSKLLKANEKGDLVGDDHPQAKLTDQQVQAMRDERENMKLSYLKLAKKYGCGLTTAKDICKGRRRNAVPVRYVRRKTPKRGA